MLVTSVIILSQNCPKIRDASVRVQSKRLLVVRIGQGRSRCKLGLKRVEGVFTGLVPLVWRILLELVVQGRGYLCKPLYETSVVYTESKKTLKLLYVLRLWKLFDSLDSPISCTNSKVTDSVA